MALKIVNIPPESQAPLPLNISFEESVSRNEPFSCVRIQKKVSLIWLVIQVSFMIGFFTFMGSVSIPDLLVIIVVLSIPTFFPVRRLYGRKFGKDRRKVMLWSVVTSLLASTVLVVALIAGLIFWLIITERM